WTATAAVRRAASATCAAKMASFKDSFFARFEGDRDGKMVAVFRIAFFAGLLFHFAPGLIWLDDAYARRGLRTLEWSEWLYRQFPHLSHGTLRALSGTTLAGMTAGLVGLRPRIAA